MGDTPLHGSCLCGQVQFHATPDRHVIACHCSQCRKQSGHFWAATFAWHRDFQLTRSDTLRWYAASDQAQRGFCGACGALPMGFIFAAIGALGQDDPAWALVLSVVVPALLWLGARRWMRR